MEYTSLNELRGALKNAKLLLSMNRVDRFVYGVRNFEPYFVKSALTGDCDSAYSVIEIAKRQMYKLKESTRQLNRNQNNVANSNCRNCGANAWILETNTCAYCGTKETN